MVDATRNGAGHAFDQALLDTIADAGYVILVEEADEADLLRSLEYPGLHVPDVAALTAPVLAGISEITVFQRPVFGGTLYGTALAKTSFILVGNELDFVWETST